MPMNDAEHLHVVIRGPSVTIEDTIKVGKSTKRLLRAISGKRWRINAVYFQCDGCALQRPDRPGPDEGWSYDNGNDYCPTCTAERAQ